MGATPSPMNFPQRNRIVSALSDIVIVVEAREKSGSLITADFALDQGKDIFVVPGRVGDSLSTGCNRLIGQGAGIIWDVNQFINDIGEIYGQPANNTVKKKKLIPKLEPELKKVYEYFDLYPKNIATVLEETKMDYLKLLSCVLALERMGLLAEPFKNNYVKQ